MNIAKQPNPGPLCPTCEKLAELVEQAGLLLIHDTRLEALLSEIESLLRLDATTLPSVGVQCRGHLTQMQALLPRLQKIYETLLVERQQLNKSISELDLLRSWSHQWSNGTAQSTHSLNV